MLTLLFMVGLWSNAADGCGIANCPACGPFVQTAVDAVAKGGAVAAPAAVSQAREGGCDCCPQCDCDRCTPEMCAQCCKQGSACCAAKSSATKAAVQAGKGACPCAAGGSCSCGVSCSCG